MILADVALNPEQEARAYSNKSNALRALLRDLREEADRAQLRQAAAAAVGAPEYGGLRDASVAADMAASHLVSTWALWIAFGRVSAPDTRPADDPFQELCRLARVGAHERALAILGGAPCPP